MHILPFCEFMFLLNNMWCQRHLTYDYNLWLHFWMVSINLRYGLLSFFPSGLLLRSQTEWPRIKCQHRIAAAFDLHGEEELSNWWKLDWSDNQHWQQSEESSYPVAVMIRLLFILKVKKDIMSKNKNRSHLVGRHTTTAISNWLFISSFSIQCQEMCITTSCHEVWRYW